MGMLSGILEKLGFDRGTVQQTKPAAPKSATPRAGKADPSAQAAPSTSQSAQKTEHGAAQSPSAPRAQGPSQATPPPTRPAPMTQVDVIAKLESLAAANPQKLNWRESIVDLLKLLDMDSSLAARKELAQELGCPPEKMADSAQMNMWLHKAVLGKVAENGGNVPKELLN